jgi:HEAT repeat protein
MPPPPSPRSEVERLTTDLLSDQPTRREAAVARLRVIGGRAVSRLAAVVESQAPAAARVAALTALDGIDDPRAAGIAVAALADGDQDVVIAALGVLRNFVVQEADTRIFEAVTVVALDKNRHGDVRLAALDALSDLPRPLVEPIRAQATTSPADPSRFDDPSSARAWLATHEAQVPLSALHDVLTSVRERERADSHDTAHGGRRDDWRGVRGAVHMALARRGSHIAVYDLRETFDAADGPLPLDFLTAMNALGDATCLEPLARAWVAASGDPQWRTRLVETASDIMRRLKLNARSAPIKKVRAKWAGFV